MGAHVVRRQSPGTWRGLWLSAGRHSETAGDRAGCRGLRFALWAGEEQGLLGSAAYVERHLAHRPPSSDPRLVPLGAYFNWRGYPIQMLPEAASLAAYLNIDNGSGKFRGIYAEGAIPICAGMAFIIWSADSAPHQGMGLIVFSVFAIAMVGFPVFAYAYVQLYRISVDTRGIKVASLFGVRFIAFADIAAIATKLGDLPRMARARK